MDQQTTFSFAEFLSQMFTGTNLAIFGAALAALWAGTGSARGVGMVGSAAAGLLSEDPGKFGSALVLQALPGTQGIYGLITAFILVFIKLDMLGDAPAVLSVADGTYFLFACLPVAAVGYFSAIHQAKVCVSGIALISKRPKELGKAITGGAMVETYAIFALLISVLLIVIKDI